MIISIYPLCLRLLEVITGFDIMWILSVGIQHEKIRGNDKGTLKAGAHVFRARATLAARVKGIVVLLTEAISPPSSFPHSLRFWLSRMKLIRQPIASTPP